MLCLKVKPIFQVHTALVYISYRMAELNINKKSPVRLSLTGLFHIVLKLFLVLSNEIDCCSICGRNGGCVDKTQFTSYSFENPYLAGADLTGSIIIDCSFSGFVNNLLISSTNGIKLSNSHGGQTKTGSIFNTPGGRTIRAGAPDLVQVSQVIRS